MVVHFLNGVLQSNKVDCICEDMDKFIKNSNIVFKKSDTLYGEINFLNVVMNNIDESVIKLFKQEKLSNKEVIRRVSRLWS